MKTPFLPTLIGSGFGSGFSPFAPGTAGALLATVVWFALSAFLKGNTLWWTTAALIWFFYIAGVWAANRLQPYGGEDPSRVVVDEMVGVWLALLAAPAGHLWYGAAAFVFFRLFDIYKPLGIRRMEKLPGGIGVMMDDVLAGIYSYLMILIIRIIVGLTWGMG
jgi:phosphatidylglycerophosphatase A